MSSAANIEDLGKESLDKEALGTPRPNPVALEVMVNVTGAKPSESAGSRDLFSEDTTTVLVFKDGAVIRLTAGVVVGQLLFLTNKKSNQEVVCQVLRKRSYKPTSCYLELLFTEEREDYWGVAFPEAKTGTAEFKMVEQVQAEETTADHPDTPVLPHRAEEVDALKREVEALREQLAKLEKKNVEEAAANAMAEAAARKEEAARQAAVQEAAKVIERVTASAPKAQMELASLQDADAGQGKAAEEKPAEVKPELLMPAAKDKQESPRSVVGMTLPVWKMEKSPEEQLLEEEAAADMGKPGAAVTEDPAEDVADEALPKPELDFTNVPKKRKRAERPPNFKARKAGLVAVLVFVAAGGTWYGKWWKYLPVGKKTVVVAPVSVGKTNAAVPVGGAAVGSADEKKEGNNTEGTEIHGGNGETAVAKEKTPEVESPAIEKPVENAKPVAAPPVKARADTGEKKTTKREKVSGKKDAGKAEEIAPKAAETMATDAPFVAAKLLKAASPVYPPDAMANYITGDVKAEVVVKASGSVGEVKVISGPKALREAAVEALKQYEYAPATQGGRAVESKAEVVVKFWFNP